MTLERWIAFVLLAIFLAYGYTAWFTMDQLLPPILQQNPVWPSSFPKILSIISILLCLGVVLNLEKSKSVVDESTPDGGDIDYRKLMQYKVGQAGALIVLMLGYAAFLRSAGFLLATFSFLFVGTHLLGERRWWLNLLVGLGVSIGIWYMVNVVLGIYLPPFPTILANLNQG